MRWRKPPLRSTSVRSTCCPKYGGKRPTLNVQHPISNSADWIAHASRMLASASRRNSPFSFSNLVSAAESWRAEPPSPQPQTGAPPRVDLHHENNYYGAPFPLVVAAVSDRRN